MSTGWTEFSAMSIKHSFYVELTSTTPCKSPPLREKLSSWAPLSYSGSCHLSTRPSLLRARLHRRQSPIPPACSVRSRVSAKKLQQTVRSLVRLFFVVAQALLHHLASHREFFLLCSPYQYPHTPYGVATQRILGTQQ